MSNCTALRPRLWTSKAAPLMALALATIVGCTNSEPTAESVAADSCELATRAMQGEVSLGDFAAELEEIVGDARSNGISLSEVVAAANDVCAGAAGLLGFEPSVADPTTTPAPEPVESASVSVLGSPLPQMTDAADDPAIGQTAPGLSGQTFDGSTVSVDTGDGRPRVLVFVAHWCPHCVQMEDAFRNWDFLGLDAELVVVSTAVDSSKPSYPPSSRFAVVGEVTRILVDDSPGDGSAGVAANAYGVSAFPTFVVVGGDGNVRLRFSGEKERPELEQLVTDALDG